MKNSNGTIGNRTRGLPICSAVPPNTKCTGVKLQGSDADHAPSTAKVKNELIYTSIPPYAFTECRGAALYTGFVAKGILPVNCVRECRVLEGKVMELLDSDVPR